MVNELTGFGEAPQACQIVRQQSIILGVQPPTALHLQVLSTKHAVQIDLSSYGQFQLAQLGLPQGQDLGFYGDKLVTAGPQRLPLLLQDALGLSGQALGLLHGHPRQRAL
jgi:hypothetical protein